MCCFSGDIKEVSKTKIFARIDESGREFLAYSMNLDTPNDVAMILPIPNQPGEAIEFIDLSAATDLFEKIDNLFPANRGMTRGLYKSMDVDTLEFTLPVEKVGAFDASFVPALADMNRLDKRFTISKDIWDKIPEYKDFSFVVFKLSKGKAERHPMAFSFKNRDKTRIFFPTVHVHHGELPAEEYYDHHLYSQSVDGWQAGDVPTPEILEKAKGILVKGAKLSRIKIDGLERNQDIYVKIGA